MTSGNEIGNNEKIQEIERSNEDELLLLLSFVISDGSFNCAEKHYKDQGLFLETL